MKKNILLALMQKSPYLEEVILEHAKNKNWSIEQYSEFIPKNWDGDGVISDYCTQKDLQNLRYPEKIPVVTRNKSNGRNIEMVSGDTWTIADMAMKFFRARGFHNYATFEMYEIGLTEISSPMPHPVLTFKETVMKHGFSFHCVYVNSLTPAGKTDDFQEKIKILRRFFRELPKPCGLFCPNIYYTGYIYRACSEENIKIPHEIAVLVNNDDSNITEYTNPTTSAIYGEISEQGYKMVRLLEHMMSNKERNKSDYVQPSGIIARQSTDILAVPHAQTAAAINLMLSSYMNNIGISDVCQHAGISIGNLKLMFVKFLGKLPGEFLRELRLNRAKELLKTSKLNLNKIALKSGYGSGMSLSLAFKREFRLTPGRYREIHSEQDNNNSTYKPHR